MVDFTYRYNRVFFESHQRAEAHALFAAASREIGGRPEPIEISNLKARDLWRALGTDRTRKVTLSQSLNGKWSVSMENIDAPVFGAR